MTMTDHTGPRIPRDFLAQYHAEVVCSLQLREREGLYLLWQSRLEKDFGTSPPRDLVSAIGSFIAALILARAVSSPRPVDAPVNALGLRRVMFAVDNIDEVVAQMVDQVVGILAIMDGEGGIEADLFGIVA